MFVDYSLVDSIIDSSFAKKTADTGCDWLKQPKLFHRYFGWNNSLKTVSVLFQFHFVVRTVQENYAVWKRDTVSEFWSTLIVISQVGAFVMFRGYGTVLVFSSSGPNMSKSTGIDSRNGGFAVSIWLAFDAHVVLSSFHMKSSSSTPRKESSVDMLNPTLWLRDQCNCSVYKIRKLYSQASLHTHSSVLHAEHVSLLLICYWLRLEPSFSLRHEMQIFVRTVYNKRAPNIWAAV